MSNKYIDANAQNFQIWNNEHHLPKKRPIFFFPFPLPPNQMQQIKRIR